MIIIFKLPAKDGSRFHILATQMNNMNLTCNKVYSNTH